MPTLRLVDPDGYTVPGGVRDSTPDTEAQDRAQLEQLAAESADQWAYDARDYRVLPHPAH